MLRQIVFVVILFVSTKGNHNLKLAYQWKSVDYEFESEATREQAIANGSFITQNIAILGIEVTEDRIFVTTPRWYLGVWSTLNYFYRNDTSASPKLIPYPNTYLHSGNPPDMISPYRPRKDSCGRLWVPDTGLFDYLGERHRYPPAFHIFNLTSNDRILKYVFPSDQITDRSYFATVTLEILSCDDIYAYFGDIASPALIVYSLKTGESRKIFHPYFERNPFAHYYKVAGIEFRWNEGIFGTALSELGPDNYSTLYFGPMTSYDTFEVSTRILRDPIAANNSRNEFKYLGSRGKNSQIGPFAYHKKYNVLFYGMFNRNAVGCWNSNMVHNKLTQGIVHEDDFDLITPVDIVVDGDDVWVTSNKLVIFMYTKLNFSEYNFRIYKSTIKEAIAGTVCDVKRHNGADSLNLNLVLFVCLVITVINKFYCAC